MLTWINDLDPRIVAAIIAAIVSILTLIISLGTKNFMEKRIHSFKLNIEHEFEQRKKIKSILSENKIRLINACESMNHRFYNFSINHKENWHQVKLTKNFDAVRNYYFTSFIYRILEVLAWTRKIEKELIFLDSTIASKEDLIFIKYLRVFSFVFCDLDSISKGFEIDKFTSEDHFFRNYFDEMSETLLDNGDIVCYDKFSKDFASYYPRISVLCDFINGINPDEKRTRWDRLQLFHITIIGFMNRFGYDYQKWEISKMEEVFKRYRENKFLKNYESLIARFKLNNEKQIKKVIKHAR